MAIIEPTRIDVQDPSNIKKYSSPLRLWHWLNLIVISGSLITVLINSTITDDNATSSLLKAELQKSGAAVNDEQTRSAAHALSDSVWVVHIYFGYALAALLAFRVILELFQLADQKFLRKIKSAYDQFNTIKKEREAARHEFTVKMIYAMFYLLLIVMVSTGLFLAFENAMVAYKSIRHSVKEVHGFCMYLILAFIVVHIIGVLLAERKYGSGIVSDMINGGREQN
ncbi:cytochrome b/b6 domain-containing protein [Mucilaginibacter sp. UYCu711]|uniref:cytochrome b/b6 domain-containing protein n=1 Tax=Mucilaginibacter sp. UYCu711 TaxID=3156339 RepID=UPI003D23488F